MGRPWANFSPRWDGFGGLPEGRGFTGCGKTLHWCHSEPFAVILSAAKDLALPAQDKLREESRPAHFHEHTRFFVGRRGDLLRMTAPTSFSAACSAPPKSRLFVPRLGNPQYTLLYTYTPPMRTRTWMSWLPSEFQNTIFRPRPALSSPCRSLCT